MFMTKVKILTAALLVAAIVSTAAVIVGFPVWQYSKAVSIDADPCGLVEVLLDIPYCLPQARGQALEGGTFPVPYTQLKVKWAARCLTTASPATR